MEQPPCLVEIPIFWGVTPSSSLEVYRRFGETCHLLDLFFDPED
jgi:hypothetical protein